MRTARIALLVLAATSLPPAARALEWAGRAGLGYVRDERTQFGAPATTTPALDVDLGLHLRDFVYQPDALQWSGGVDYRRVSIGGATDTVENRLDYRLQATAFSRRTSPITLSAFASRQQADGTATGLDYGVTTNSYGGSVAARLRNAPALEASYARAESSVSNSLRPDSFLNRDTFGVGTAHSGAIFGATARYGANLSEGTYASDNFNDHRVDLGSSVRLSPRAQLQLADYFYRRDPTSDSQYNPRQDLNLFSSTLRLEGAPGEAQHHVIYQYSTARTESALVTEADARSDVRYQIDAPIVGKRWYLLGLAGASFDQRTRDATREQTAGQSLGATLSLREASEDRSYELHAGPTVGLLEPFDGSVQYGFGTNAGASYQRMLAYLRWGAQYGVTYSDAIGAPGTLLYQQASVNLEGNAGLGTLRGTVLADSNRSNDPLFGSRASRSLLLRGEYALRLSAVFLDASVRDGLSNALRTTINGDGLLLGPGYDVHARHVTLGARSTAGAFFGSMSVRLATSDAPDRPAQDDLELQVEAGVRVGSFGMSFNERYLTALERAGARGSINVFQFRVYRLFGSGR